MLHSFCFYFWLDSPLLLSICQKQTGSPQLPRLFVSAALSGYSFLSLEFGNTFANVWSSSPPLRQSSFARPVAEAATARQISPPYLSRINKGQRRLLSCGCEIEPEAAEALKAGVQQAGLFPTSRPPHQRRASELFPRWRAEVTVVVLTVAEPGCPH